MREAKTDSRPTEIPRPTYARALPCAIQYRPVGARIYFLRGDPKPKRIADQRRFHAPGASTLHGMTLGGGVITTANIRKGVALCYAILPR